MDAPIHTIKAFTSVNDMTNMFAARAIDLISGNFRTAYLHKSKNQKGKKCSDFTSKCWTWT